MKTHVIFGNARPARDWLRRAGVPLASAVIVVGPGRLYRATRGLDLGALTLVAVYRTWDPTPHDRHLLLDAQHVGARLRIAP